MTVLAAHQPDLLPWSGFWHKMALADVFDVAIYDQYQPRRFMQRVKMRGSWCTLPVFHGGLGQRIVDVQTVPVGMVQVIDAVRGRYQGARFWKKHGPWLIKALEEAESPKMWMTNLSLILAVRDRLGIETPVAIAVEPTKAGTDGLIQLCRRYEATSYLSGAGGLAYMDPIRFQQSQIGLMVSAHVPSTEDSIVSVLMDEPDPMVIVRAER